MKPNARIHAKAKKFIHDLDELAKTADKNERIALATSFGLIQSGEKGRLQKLKRWLAKTGDSVNGFIAMSNISEQLGVLRLSIAVRSVPGKRPDQYDMWCLLESISSGVLMRIDLDEEKESEIPLEKNLSAG